MKIDSTDRALLAELGVPPNPDPASFAAIAVVALARRIGQLQQRLTELETAKQQPRKRGLFAALKAKP